jgi:hypothetical protein
VFLVSDAFMQREHLDRIAVHRTDDQMPVGDKYGRDQ